MFTERDLVRLVFQLNPYAPPPVPFAPNMILAPPPDAVVANARDLAIQNANNEAALDLFAPDFTVFNFETQDNPAYEMDGRRMFKRQERIIRRALRFKYRYPILNGGGALATDHVLVGYEGGGGP